MAGGRLEQVREIFRRHHADLIKVPEREERPELYYRVDGHWNRAGHAWVAGAVAERIVKAF